MSSESLICSPSQNESQITQHSRATVQHPRRRKRKGAGEPSVSVYLSLTSNRREDKRGPRPAPAQGATKKRTRCVGDGCIKAPALTPFEVPLMEPLPLTLLSPFTIRSLVPKIEKKKRTFRQGCVHLHTNRPGIPGADNGRRRDDRWFCCLGHGDAGPTPGLLPVSKPSQ